jgi:voltage-gated potassium channel
MITAAILTLPFLLLQDDHRRGPWHTIGTAGSYLVWAAFVFEAAVMLTVVRHKRQWLRDHPLELAIIVLTPPFLFTAVQGLRVLRVLRLLRLFRLTRLFRRLFTPDGLRYMAVLAVLVLLVSAEAFHTAEKQSFGNSIYWALATMTTVGYGDITAHTTAGKIVACIIMLVGIGFFAVLTGAVAQQFLATEVEAVEEEEHDLVASIREISAQLRRLEEQALLQTTRGRNAPHGRT